MAGPTGRHRDRGLRLTALAVAVGLLAGCRGRERERSEEVAEAGVVEPPVEREPALEVGVSGCSGLVQDDRGLVCLTRKATKDKPLYLWLDDARDSTVVVRFSGVPIEAERRIDPEGLMLTIIPPRQQGRLELSTDSGVWEMELRPVTEIFETLRKQVQASWKAGDATSAIAHYERAMTELDGNEAALLSCSVGKVLLAAGDYDRVLEIAEQVSKSSVISCTGKASLLAAYVQIYLRPDFNAAERSLRTAESVRVTDLDTRIGAAYWRGVLEHWLGKVDESLRSFERAARLARMVRSGDHYASAVVMQAIALARLGRFAEAEALAVEAVEPELNDVYPAVALDIRSTAAWIAVLRREDDPSAPDPTTELRDLIAEYEKRGDAYNLENRRVELALTLTQNSELGAATAELAKIDGSVLDLNILVWFELTSARVDSLGGDFHAAEAHLERANLLAELSQDRELNWRVKISLGDLERERGRTETALQHFSDASRLADKLAMSVSGDAGRGRFVTSHSRADVALVDLLLEKGNWEGAMCAALAARARHLRGLWARLRPPLAGAAERRYRDLLSEHRERKQALVGQIENSWVLSTTDLSALRERLGAEGEQVDQLLSEATTLLEQGAPTWSCDRALPSRAGEVVLTVMPSSNKRSWHAMLALRVNDGTLNVETTEVELDAEDVEAAADLILKRFSMFIGSAKHLRIVPMGAFVAVDFHRLWLARGHEGPQITYSLGLGTVPDSDRRYGQTAAIIAGSENLAAVTSEVQAVSDQLRERNWTVVNQWTPDVVQQPTLLHYAGHGVNATGLGWDSALELPGLGRITAMQIVAGQRSPEIVILGACSAGRVTSESLDGGMNLAAAFLLAGAQLVIAPTRDVDDNAAYELGRGLYRELESGDPDGLVRALSALQRDQLLHPRARTEAEMFSNWRPWTP